MMELPEGVEAAITIYLTDGEGLQAALTIGGLKVLPKLVRVDDLQALVKSIGLSTGLPPNVGLPWRLMTRDEIVEYKTDSEDES